MWRYLARTYWALFAVLLLAAFLRTYQLGTESLWSDEGVSLRFASMGGPAEIVEASKTDNNYPTYYLILHYWVWLFGDSEFSLRLPSALSGLLAVLVMYKVGSLLFGRSVGLTASLILAVSPFHIQYSQEARVYNLMALLALVSFYCFIKVLRERKLAVQMGYVLSTIALMYCHVYGLFIVLAQNIYFAAIFLGRTFRSRDDARPSLGRWMGLQALLVVLYIPGFILLTGWLSQTKDSTRTWIPPPSLGSVYRDLVSYSGSPLLLALLLTFALLAVIALVRSGATGNLLLLLVWFLTSVVLPILISSFSTPIFHARYGIAGSLVLYLLAAKGVEVASGAFSRAFLRGSPKAPKTKIAWLIVTALLVMLFIVQVRSYYMTVIKQQWREVAQYVDTHAQTDDLILIEGYGSHETLFNYYSERTDIEIKGTHSSGSGEAMKPSVEAHDRVWSVRPRVTKARESLRLEDSAYEEGHTLIDYKQYLVETSPSKDVDLALYEKRKA